MNVAFFVRHFTERGTEVAIYDYAKYNEELLHNHSIIVCLTERVQHTYTGLAERTTYAKFAARFPIIELDHISDMKRVIRECNIHVFHTLTQGGPDIYHFDYPVIWKGCRTIKQCVFDTTCPEADVYCCISDTVNRNHGTQFPVLPHIVEPPLSHEGDLRAVLGIPPGATVFGRHGGLNTFDCEYVHDVIAAVAQERPDIYFVFMNTACFMPPQPNVMFLEGTTDVSEKARFIGTCDAMIHARWDGETFGLAIAEFAVRGKPIVAQDGCDNRAHFDILGDKVVAFGQPEQLHHILTHFHRYNHVDMRENGYHAFSPEAVMAQFKQLCEGERTTRPT